jgi:hypothetical protein
MKLARLATMVAAAAIMLAAPAHADVDTDFASQLHEYGIYGQKDFNAWLGKITCDRLDTGLDADAYESVSFLAKNLGRKSTTAQHWQFLGAAIPTYCPEQQPVLARVAADQQVSPADERDFAAE